MRKNLLLSSIASVVLFIAAFGCATAQKNEKEGGTTRKLTFEVQSNFRESPKGKTFHLERGNEYEDLRYDNDFKWIGKALALEGLTETTSEKAYYKVEVRFDVDKPIGGIAIGIISPYKHKLTLKARNGSNLVWQVIARGPSEHEERREFTTVLLGAARHYFGKTTTRTEDLSMYESDAKVQEILR